MSTKIETIGLSRVNISGGTQPRAMIDEQIVAEYADLYREGVELRPVTVFFDGVAYWLADGFHRYWARKRIDAQDIVAEVHEGTLRDAILFSVGANATHGLRRTNADKRKAVLTLLEDDEWSQWVDSEIARQCRVNRSTVTRTRTILAQSASMKAGARSAERKFVHPKTGKPSTMKTGKIGGGRKPPSSRPATKPPRPTIEAEPTRPCTNLDLDLDPSEGARVLVGVMGVQYAKQLIECLTSYLNAKGV